MVSAVTCGDVHGWWFPSFLSGRRLVTGHVSCLRNRNLFGPERCSASSGIEWLPPRPPSSLSPSSRGCRTPTLVLSIDSTRRRHRSGRDTRALRALFVSLWPLSPLCGPCAEGSGLVAEWLNSPLHMRDEFNYGSLQIQNFKELQLRFIQSLTGPCERDGYKRARSAETFCLWGFRWVCIYLYFVIAQITPSAKCASPRLRLHVHRASPQLRAQRALHAP